MPPAWSPTQQIRALLLINEIAAHLASEARLRTLHGHAQLAGQLTAVGKRALPAILVEMSDWSALKLAGGRDSLRDAIEQYALTQEWAERLTTAAVSMLREGERFTDAGRHLDGLAHAVSSADEPLSRTRFEHHIALLHRYREAHAAEDPAAGASWSPAIDRLFRAAAALGLKLPPPPPSTSTPITAPPRSDRAGGASAEASAGSTPYQPTTDVDSDINIEEGAGTRALRRRQVTP